MAEMERAALSWAKEARIRDVYGDGLGDSAHVAPLYPMILGSAYRVFGWSDSERWISQAALAVIGTSLAISLTPVLARRARLSISSGLAAGTLLAISPLNFWIETSGAWEQPYSALLLLGMLLTFISLHNCRWTSWPLVVTAGVIFGICALLSPALLPAAGLMLLVETGSMKGTRGRVALRILVLVLIPVMLVTPWVIRNYKVLGGFVPLRSNFGLELWIGNNPGSTGKTYSIAENPQIYRIHPFKSGREQAELRRVGELRYMHDKSRMARQWIAENPHKFALLTLQRFQLFWFPSTDMWRPDVPLRRWKSGIMIVAALGAFCEIVRLFVARNEYRWLLVSALFCPSFLYLITHVDPRYRYPVFGVSVLLTCNLMRDALLGSIHPKRGWDRRQRPMGAIAEDGTQCDPDAREHREANLC